MIIRQIDDDEAIQTASGASVLLEKMDRLQIVLFIDQRILVLLSLRFNSFIFGPPSLDRKIIYNYLQND